jgi:hypothetical protein
MSLYKRGKWYHMDDVVNGTRYRLPLKTTNWQTAKGLEKDKLNEITEGKLGSVGMVARQGFNAAVDVYLDERKLFKAPKTHLTKFERSKPL